MSSEVCGSRRRSSQRCTARVTARMRTRTATAPSSVPNENVMPPSSKPTEMLRRLSMKEAVDDCQGPSSRIAARTKASTRIAPAIKRGEQPEVAGFEPDIVGERPTRGASLAATSPSSASLAETSEIERADDGDRRDEALGEEKARAA